MATVGTGLGLTITSLLTKIMGGDLAVPASEGRQGQHISRQAHAVGSLASAHRFNDGLSGCAATPGRGERSWWSMTSPCSAS